MKRLVLVLISPPGAGKGTLAKQLVERNNFTSFSTGELLREEIRKGTELGIKITNVMDSGHLVSDDIVAEIAENALLNSTGDVILDGYPRTVNQVHLLNLSLQKLNSHQQEFLLLPILLVVKDESLLIDRITQIRAKTDNRKGDDDPIAIRKRLQVYYEETRIGLQLA